MNRLRALLLRPSAHAVLVIATGLAAYATSFGAPFTLDDRRCIVANPLLRSFEPFLHPREAAASLAGSLGCGFESRFVGHLTLALNYRVGGLEVSGYHLVNVAIHLAAALLVYALVALTFRTPFFEARAETGTPVPESGARRLVPLFAALLFVAHPLQTQAVTYVTQRFASLATLLYLAAVVLYVRARLEAPGLDRAVAYAGALAATVLAMGTKEMAFTIPFALILYEVLFLRGHRVRRAAALLPFLLTLLVVPALRGAFHAHGVAELDASMRAAGRSPLSRWEYAVTQVRVVVTYLRLFLAPAGQNLDWDYPTHRSLLELPVLLSLPVVGGLLAAGVLLVARSRRSAAPPELRLAGFGVLWFFLGLSVESLVPLTDVMVEHRMYLPSVGLCAAVAALAMLLRDRLSAAWPAAARAVVPALSLAVAALAVTTLARNVVWSDDVRLWEDVAAKSPRKVRPRLELGALYLQRGRLDDAHRAVRTALDLDPGSAEAYNSLGVILRRAGRLDEALAAYVTALQLAPTFAEARQNVGLLHLAQGRPDEAMRDLQEAVRLKPDYVDAHNNLGALYAQQGRLDLAVQEWQTVLRLNPAHARARANLAQALGAMR